MNVSQGIVITGSRFMLFFMCWVLNWATSILILWIFSFFFLFWSSCMYFILFVFVYILFYFICPKFISILLFTPLLLSGLGWGGLEGVCGRKFNNKGFCYRYSIFYLLYVVYIPWIKNVFKKKKEMEVDEPAWLWLELSECDIDIREISKKHATRRLNTKDPQSLPSFYSRFHWPFSLTYTYLE